MRSRSRSREGAWIEIASANIAIGHCPVAPVRERGLKYLCSIQQPHQKRRSREGAWIEIS